MIKRSLILLLLLSLLLWTGCAAQTGNAPEDDPIDRFYTLQDNGNYTYSYIMKDRSGNVLCSGENVTKPPHTRQISENVFSLTTQSGTGLSSSRTVFCDVENSLTSTFYYVLGAKNGYVVYADYLNGEHFVIVQDMFDEEGYFCKYKLKNVSLAMDFATDCTFDGGESATVTYLTGKDYTQTQLLITIP